LVCGPGYFVQGVCDNPISMFGGVLVDQRCSGAGVAQSRHELFRSGADLGRKRGTGMAQVVEMNGVG
jgi:hypothetical protein